MNLYLGSRIRFTVASKFKDFKKGDTGKVRQITASFPWATETIYIIELEKIEGPNNQVWATSKEVEPWDQLALIM